MTTLSHPLGYAEESTRTRRRERTGGPRRPSGPSRTPAETSESPMLSTLYGSHMPLDTDIHWVWSNPLNVIPAGLLLIIAIALVGLLVG